MSYNQLKLSLFSLACQVDIDTMCATDGSQSKIAHPGSFFSLPRNDPEDVEDTQHLASPMHVQTKDKKKEQMLQLATKGVNSRDGHSETPPLPLVGHPIPLSLFDASAHPHAQALSCASPSSPQISRVKCEGNLSNLSGALCRAADVGAEEDKMHHSDVELDLVLNAVDELSRKGGIQSCEETFGFSDNM